MEQLRPQLPHPTHRAAGKKKRSARHPRPQVRPRNAFILFRADFVEQNLPPKGVIYDSKKQSQMIGKIWAGMSEAEKEPWITMSNDEKERYWVSHQSLVTSRRSNKHPKPDADVLTSQTNTPITLSASDPPIHSATSLPKIDSTSPPTIGREEWEQLRPFLPSHWTDAEWYVIVEYLTAHALDIMDALRDGRDLESILHIGPLSTHLSPSLSRTIEDPQHLQDITIHTMSTGDYSSTLSFDIPGPVHGSGSGHHHGLQYVGTMDSSSFSGQTDSSYSFGSYSFDSQDMVSTTPNTSSPLSNDLSGHNNDTTWSNHYDFGESQSDSTYFWDFLAEANNHTPGILLDHTSGTDSGDPATFGTSFGRSSGTQQYSSFSIHRTEELDYTYGFYDFAVSESDPMSVGLFENGRACLNSNSPSFFEIPSDVIFTGTGLNQSTSLQISEGVGFPPGVCEFSVEGPDFSYGDFFSDDAAGLNANSVALHSPSSDSPVAHQCLPALNQEVGVIPSSWECAVDEQHATIGAIFENGESASIYGYSPAQHCFESSNFGLGLYPYLGSFPAETPDPTYGWFFEGNWESLFDSVPVALDISDMHMPLYFPVESNNAISQNWSSLSDSLLPVL